MNNITKIGIVVLLVIAVVGVIFLKKKSNPPAASGNAKASAATTDAALQSNRPTPRLVDLGAGKCIPCKMMAPILEELKERYAGRFQVDVIDILEDNEAIQKYDVGIIPTQIFYDASGKELFRHEGFMSKEDILAKWNELGFDFEEVPDTKKSK